MLTLQYIMKRTTRQRREDSLYVRILKSKAGYDKQGRAFFAAQTQSNKHRTVDGKLIKVTNPVKYVSVITILNTSKMYAKVSCSCADFTYRWEFPLSEKGAADIEYSNGDPTDTTNPLYIPAACKHLYKIFTVIRPKLGI